MNCVQMLKEIETLNNSPKPEFITASTELSSGIAIRWDRYEGADRYNLYKNGVLLETNLKDVFYFDKNVEVYTSPSTEYKYQVQAMIGSCGSELSNEAIGRKLSDIDGYRFLSTFFSYPPVINDPDNPTDDEITIKYEIYGVDNNNNGFSFEINYNGTWIELQGTGTFSTTPLESQNYEIQIRSKDLVTQIKFLPESDTNTSKMEYRSIYIDCGETLTSGHQMCQNLSSLADFNILTNTSFNTLDSAWENCTSLSYFPEIDIGECEELNSTWKNCHSLITFGWINAENVISLNSTWSNCYVMDSFPWIDTSNVTTFNYTWENNLLLNSFPEINTVSATELIGTWYGCSSLKSFPLINTSNVTTLLHTWENCVGFLSFPEINTSKVTIMDYAWAGTISLKLFPLLNTSSVTSMVSTFQETGVAYFPSLTFSAVLSLDSTWKGSKILSLPIIDSGACTNFNSMVMDCTNLECMSGIDTSAQTDTTDMFTNTPVLLRPNADEQAQIIAGAQWENTDPCPIQEVFRANTQLNSLNITIYVSDDIEIDLGDDNWVPVTAGEHNLVALDYYVKYRSTTNLSHIKFISDTFMDIHISKGVTLTSMHQTCLNLSNLTLFSFEGKNQVNTLESAFQGCTGLINVFMEDTSYVTNFKSVLESSNFVGIQDVVMDFSKGVNFERAFANTPLQYFGIPLNTKSGEYFKEMFLGCGNLSCLTTINTQNKQDTTDMFSGCDSLVQPDTRAQDLILQGIHWINSGECPEV